LRRLCEASSSSSSSIAPPPDGGPRARVAGHRHDQAPGFAASLAGGGQRRGGAPNQPLKKTPRRRRRRPPRSRSRPSPAQRQDRGPPCVSNAVDAGAPPWSPTSGGPNATEQTRAAPLRAQRAPPVAAALVSAPAMPAPTLAAPAAQPRAKGREMHCSNKHRIGHRRSRLFMLHARARATARLSKARRRGGGRGRADGAPLGKHARAAQGARRKARGARRGAQGAGRGKKTPPPAPRSRKTRARRPRAGGGRAGALAPPASMSLSSTQERRAARPRASARMKREKRAADPFFLSLEGTRRGTLGRGGPATAQRAPVAPPGLPVAHAVLVSRQSTQRRRRGRRWRPIALPDAAAAAGDDARGRGSPGPPHPAPGAVERRREDIPPARSGPCSPGRARFTSRSQPRPPSGCLG